MSGTPWAEGTGTAPPHGGLPPLLAGAGPAEAARAVVLLHGRGGSAEGIAELATVVHVPGTAWIAPRAAGHTWYPHSFLAPLSHNEPELSSALAVVERIVDDLVALGIPPSSIAVGGFSQGGCLAVTSVARRKRPLGAAFALSGGLIGPPGGLPEFTGSAAGCAAFLGCSDVDPHIPESRVRESARILESLGARVDLRIYPGMAHTVNREELEVVGALVQGLDAATDRG